MLWREDLINEFRIGDRLRRDQAERTLEFALLFNQSVQDVVE